MSLNLLMDLLSPLISGEGRMELKLALPGVFNAF